MKQYKNITLLILGVFTLINFQVYSQPKYTKSKTLGTDGDTIYFYVEQMPEFPGGKLALRRWIAEHLELPQIDIVGTTFLRFEVKKTGEVGKIEIQKSVDPVIDEMIIKAIKTLPEFKPGLQNGKPVNVWYSVPVRIQLE